MDNSYWIRSGDTLMIGNDREIIVPDAEAIYSYQFGNSLNINGLSPSGTGSDPFDLKFSKYPLILKVKFETNSALGEIDLKIIAGQGNIEIAIDDFFSRNADHALVNGTWHPFVRGSMVSVRSTLLQNGITKVGSITLGTYLKLKDDVDLPIDQNTENLADPEIVIGFSHDVPVGSTFTGNLYPYQLQGYKWLSYIDKNNIGCILGDEMGLGKTIQLIALLHKYEGKKDPALVVCPATLLENWHREIMKFAPYLKKVIHRGPSRAGVVDNLLDNDVIITSYETLVRDRYMFRMHKWNIIILDEAQAIKNPEAIRTKTIKSIPRRSAIAATGTPVQNNLIDLWSIIDFVLPGYLGKLSAFEANYMMNVESAERLEPKVRPLMLRRTLDDVAIDLPDLIDIQQPLKMDRRSSIEYNQFRQDIIDSYGQNCSLVMLQKLRMYCAHRNLLFGINEDPAEHSQKYNRVLEILDEIVINRDKAIIFTSWQDMIDIFVQDIERRFGIFTAFIDGRTPVYARQNIVDHFNNIEKPAVLILNPNAAGVGLNITGANHVVHYNLEWNPAVVDQATKRAYRIGQRRPVRVHMPYYRDTVEEVIVERLEFKRSVAGSVVIGIRGVSEDYQDIIKALGKVPKGEDNE